MARIVHVTPAERSRWRALNSLHAMPFRRCPQRR